MLTKHKSKPTFKLKYEVDVPFNKNYQFPVYAICESKSKVFLAIMVEFQFYLLENNRIIFQIEVEECRCCFSNDEKYFALIFQTTKAKLILLNLQNKYIVWNKYCQIFTELPTLNFYRSYLMFIENKLLIRYSINGKISVFQLFQNDDIRQYQFQQLIDEDDNQVEDIRSHQHINGFSQDEDDDSEELQDKIIFKIKLGEELFDSLSDEDGENLDEKDSCQDLNEDIQDQSDYESFQDKITFKIKLGENLFDSNNDEYYQNFDLNQDQQDLSAAQQDEDHDDSSQPEERINFQAKIHEDFFLYTQDCKNQNIQHYTKNCYIFTPLSLKIIKRFFCHCECLIKNLSNIVILQAQLSDDALNINNLFIIREIVNHKIIRSQKCNNLIIENYKTVLIKMALYCFNLDGFYKIDFTTGKQLFKNFSYPNFLYNSITPCNQEVFSEPYFYGSFNHQDNNRKQKTLSLFKFIV